MIPLRITQICDIVAGSLSGTAFADVLVDGIVIDSRKIVKNTLFCALAGDQFDGHDFAQKAIKEGAIGVIASRKLDDDIPHIIVENTRKALGDIAAYVRLQMSTKVVALTGSSGKTTVKEMTAAILSYCGETLYTQGNFNNDIGVPLTLLRLTAKDKFAVIELGANHLGEIAYTAALVKPQSALINNVAEAHIEGFGSLSGVAKAKGEIFQGLAKGGIAIINLDSCSDDWYTALKHTVVWTFSLRDRNADFYATNIESGMVNSFTLHTPQGDCQIELPLAGHHNISNAIAASALAMSVGARLPEIKKGLSNLQPIKGRLFPIKLNNDQLILDDAYNANMGSMKAAIQVLAEQAQYKVLVVGDMAELGENVETYHQEIGEFTKAMAIDCVVSVGNVSRLISQHSGKGHHFADKASAVTFLQQLLHDYPKLTMLVKGSRSAKMEEIIESIKISNSK